MTATPEPDLFPGLIDLAAEAAGGRALACSDEFFAGRENLLKPGRGVFLPEEYTDRGKWMDGWESRRRRGPGHDWCTVRLGVRGEIHAVDIDTNHFLGNHPAEASIDSCDEPQGDDPETWLWQPLVPRCAMRPGSQHLHTVPAAPLATHVRLNIYPDGGVARLRIWGVPRPRLATGELTDLASRVNGALVTACSDGFFGRPENMLRPTAPVNMGDGWETRRRRGPGHDWAVIRLAAPGTLRRLEVDTSFFKGNHPETCSLDICDDPRFLGPLTCGDAAWTPLLEDQQLGPDQLHVFDQLPAHGAVRQVRLNIFPDGGVARLRIWGHIEEAPDGDR